MREHEMRERLERYLRKAAVPTMVGMTIGMAGCGSSEDSPPAPLYGAVFVDASSAVPDAAKDSPGVTPLYMAVIPDAGADADASDGDIGAVPDYIAPMPLYMAVMPDSG